jgi:hypothetical protein
MASSGKISTGNKLSSPAAVKPSGNYQIVSSSSPKLYSSRGNLKTASFKPTGRGGK